MTEYSETPIIPDPLEGQYVGFWVKMFAPVLDVIIFIPLYLAIKMLCGEQHPILGEVAFSVFALIAYGLFFASRWQATPGMRVLNFHACDDHGSRLSYGRSLWWSAISSLGMVLCFSGVIYMQYRFDLVAILQLLRSCAEENVRAEDCMAEVENITTIPYETFYTMLLSSVGLAVFLLLIWALSVALARDKSGFHNLICHTRFVKGRL